ncbi:hypothetical protein N824_21385 [Pedobacter sp. V48]|nr:hypothetical protein N824_21385 [Pedobacter sp. V48]
MLKEATPIIFRDLAGINAKSRFSAANIRRRIASRLSVSERVVIDFKGVQTISRDFAEECFIKLQSQNCIVEISQVAELRNASPYIHTIVSSALNKAYLEVIVKHKDLKKDCYFVVDQKPSDFRKILENQL